MPKAQALSYPHRLRLAWAPDAPGSPAVAFAGSIASYLFASCQKIVVETSEGELLDDLELDDLVMSPRSGRIATIAFRTGCVDPAGEWRLELSSSEPDSGTRCHLTLEVCDSRQSWLQVEWLQASVEHPAPIPTLAIPRSSDGAAVSVFHGIIVLAAHFGQVALAELERIDFLAHAAPVARWYFDNPPIGAVPVVAHENEPLWLATTLPPSTPAPPLCWVKTIDADSLRGRQTVAAPDAAWQERLSNLLAASPPDGSELVAHLQTLGAALVPCRIGPLSETPLLSFMVPPQHDIVCALVPTASEVVIGIDFSQGTHIVRQAILHAYGHILLGHVRPGDLYGHWDSVESLVAARPQRRWDREVRQHLAPWCHPPKEANLLQNQPRFNKGDLVQRVNRPEFMGVVRPAARKARGPGAEPLAAAIFSTGRCSLHTLADGGARTKCARIGLAAPVLPFRQVESPLMLRHIGRTRVVRIVPHRARRGYDRNRTARSHPG